MPTIEFKYALNDEVCIKDTSISGIVVGLYHGINGNRFEVLYIYEGTQKAEYIPEALLRLSSTKKVGF